MSHILIENYKQRLSTYWYLLRAEVKNKIQGSSASISSQMETLDGGKSYDVVQTEISDL